MRRMLSRPWLVVAAFLAATLFFALQLPKARLDNDVVHFVPEDHPSRAAFARVEEDFSGGQVSIMIGLKAPGATVFEAESLRAIAELSDRLAALPAAEKVESLATADFIAGGEGELAVESIVPKGFAGSPEEVREVKRRIQAWDLYARALVSDDYRSTEILFDIKLTGEGLGEADPKIAAYDGVKAVLADMGLERKGWGVYVSGTPAMAAIMSRSMQRDLVVLIPLVLLVVVLVLYLSFRRLGGILLPLSGVLVSTVWSVGLMALLGIELTIVATVLPVMMIAVGSAYGIHVVSHYYDKGRQARRGYGRAEQLELMLQTLSEVGQPVFLAAITTVAGFASLCFTSIKPIFSFGVFSSFGTAVAWLCSLTLVPALVLIRGPGPESLGGEAAGAGQDAELAALERDRFSRAVARAFMALVRRPKTVMGVAAAVIVVSVLGMRLMVVDNNLIGFFNDRTDIARSDKFLREEFAGTKVLSIVIDGGKKGAMNDPEALRAMDDIAAFAARDPSVGKVLSYTQLVKRMNQVLNAGEPVDRVRPRETASHNASSAEPAFGFGSGGGEPAFGFEEAPAAPKAGAAEPAGAAAAAPAAGDEALARAPDLLKTLHDAYSLAPRAGIGAKELIELVDRATNYEGYAYYEIPADPARYGKASREELASLIGNYLVLASAGTRGFADDPLEPSSARMTVVLNATGNLATERVVAETLAYAKSRLPEGYTAEASGIALIEKSITDLIVSSQVLSVLSSLVMVFAILWIYYRSFAAGILGTLPLAASVLVDFALMGFLRINLDMSTAMVASISIGTGIDYTIHFMSGYYHAWNRPGGRDPLKASYRTFLTSGKAIILNALSVAAGFLVLVGSSFNPLAYLGILIAVTMLTSSLVSLSLLPVIVNAAKPAYLGKKLLF